MRDLIIVQAFGDIIHINSLPTSEFILVCYNEKINSVLVKLYPGIKIIFHQIGFNEIFNLRTVFPALKKMKALSKSLKGIKISSVYTFSNGYDWITPILISKINYSRPIYILDIYENTTSNERTSLKANLKAMYLRLISGVRFEAFTKQYYNVVTFHNIQRIKPSVGHGHERKFVLEIKDPEAIVILDSPALGVLDYIKTMERIISVIRSCGFKVYFKPHPRLVNNINGANFELPPEVPIELIDLSKCKMVLGIATSGLYNNNCPNNYSFINYFEFSKSHLREDVLTHIQRNKIETIDNIEKWLQ